MTPEALEAWKITQGVTSQAFADLVKSKDDKTIKKVTRHLLHETGDLVNRVNHFASRRLIIEVLGTFVERLKIEDEVEEKHGPPPTADEVYVEELKAHLTKSHDPSEDDGTPETGRLM